MNVPMLGGDGGVTLTNWNRVWACDRLFYMQDYEEISKIYTNLTKKC
jgi:hypothetical protein